MLESQNCCWSCFKYECLLANADQLQVHEIFRHTGRKIRKKLVVINVRWKPEPSARTSSGRTSQCRQRASDRRCGGFSRRLRRPRTSGRSMMPRLDITLGYWAQRSACTCTALFADYWAGNRALLSYMTSHLSLTLRLANVPQRPSWPAWWRLADLGHLQCESKK